MFPDKLRLSLFADRFPNYARTAALSAHSDFVGSRVYACLGMTCHLHFLQNDRGHCGNTGVERTSNESQHTKLTLEKKIPAEYSPAAPAVYTFYIPPYRDIYYHVLRMMDAFGQQLFH